MPKKYLFIFLFFFNFFIFAEEKIDPYITATISSEQSSIVGGCVNAITGDFIFSSKDLIAQGEESISLNHIYTSRFRKHPFPGGLLLSEHLYVICDGNVSFKITEPSGIQLLYRQPKYSIKGIKDIKNHIENDITLELTPESLKGLSNASDLSISGRLNLRNNKVIYNQNNGSLTVFSSNGSIRYYTACRGSLKDLLKDKYKNKKSDDYYREFSTLSNIFSFFFKLEKEKLSNGNWIFYEYDGNDFPIKIYSTNPHRNKIYSSVNLNISNKFTCTTSCSKTLEIQGDILKDKINQREYWRQKHKEWKWKEKERISAFIYKSIICPENPNVNFNYLESDGKVITDKVLPDGRMLHIDYYTLGDHIVNNTKINVPNNESPLFMRVKSISIPGADDKGLQKIYHFIYHLDDFENKGGTSEVYDIDNNKTIYRYSKELRLETIHRYFLKDNQYQLKNFEKLIWGKTNVDATFLLGKIFFDSKQKPVYAKRYFYDDKGNLSKEVIYGNLSGLCNSELEIEGDFPKENGIESFTKHNYFSNDSRNLLVKQQDDSGLITTYQYQNDTDKITAKFISFKNQDQIKQRTFYSYDEDNILIEEIQDNGISRNKTDLTNVTKRIKTCYFPRKVEPYGLIDKIEIYYLNEKREEKLLKAEKFEYNSNRRIVKKEVLGSDKNSKYTLNYEYDAKGNIKHANDPIGREASYEYDLNNNKSEEIDFSEKSFSYRYDRNDRLVKKNIHDNKTSYDEIYEYDLKSNLIAKTDIHKNITNYTYDVFGNLIKETSPTVQDTLGNTINAETSYIYDDLGRQIEKIDPLNNKTKTFYAAYNKPYLIEYPDGTSEKYIYYLDGTLKEHINQEGTITRYEYDYFKRVISKQILSSKHLLREEIYNYDAFDLISKVDTDGNITKYTYDLPGRLIKEEFFDKDGQILSIEEYQYDAFGYLKKKVEGNLLATNYKADNSGRILEKSKSSYDNNTILFWAKFEYDKADNKTSIISNISNKEAIERNNYDVFNRLIKTVDANKDETNIIYDDILDDPTVSYRKTYQNALNQKIVTSYDALDREISIEHINPKNQSISLEEKFYDLNGNLTRQVSTIYNLDCNPDKPTRQVTTCWQYDNMNRLISLIEAFGTNDEKRTNYSYTSLGNLKCTIKPDKNQLINEYDPLGNKIALYSSDRSISYEFAYNNLNQLIEAKDAIENRRTVKKYDASGNLLEETLSNGLKIKNDYNLLDDKIKCVFPDNSFAEYTYDPLNLKQVIRKDKEGLEQYKHEFLQYDLSGNLLKERLIQNSGTISYEIDPANQITKISHEITDKQNNKKENSECIVYDEIGRISSIKRCGFLEGFCEYQYDDLNQIIKETGLFSNSYEFDSNYNRLKKNDDSYQINNLNEILSTSNETITYDKNGNPVKKITKDGEINYFYDALNRLIKIEKPKDYILEFSYDPFNRRISKRVLKYSYVWGWQDVDFRYFLYDGQNEIGSYDKNFNQQELRILSNTEDAEIGSAIAFEIINKKTNSIEIFTPIYDTCGSVNFIFLDDVLQEHYKYSSFGERKIFSSWGYEKQNSQINNPWQYSSKRIDDESGLIYFGRRYYDPGFGRWLTCDPKGFKDGMNLYAYVHNDPLINLDLYGLYTTPQWLKNSAGEVADFAVNTWYNPRFQGGLQAFGGLTEAMIGGGMALTSAGIAAPIGGAVMTHGLDHFFTGLQTAFTGTSRNTLTNQLLQKTGISSQTANMIDSVMSIAGSMGGTAAIRASQITAFPSFRLPMSTNNSYVNKANSYPGVNSTTGLSLNNRAYSGLDLEKIIKDVKQSITKNARGNLNFFKDKNILKNIEEFVGKDARVFHNRSKDLLIESKDGLKQFRIDLNNPYPHINQPHCHLIKFKKIKGQKFKTLDVRIFPKDVVKE